MTRSRLKHKIAALTMVKDESDIIELFIKVNSKFIDHFFIVDHASTDNTLKILMLMKSAGYPLTILNYNEPTYDQVFVTNSLLKIAIDVNDYAFFIPLDADEFIYNPSQTKFIDILKAEIEFGNCGLLKWVNYAPTSDNYFSINNPLFHLFRKRSVEPIQFYKVIIPDEVAGIGSTTMGNHQFLINENNSNYSFVSPFLQHCPVRSSQQIIAKSIIGSHRFSLKKDRLPNEGFHWDNITNKIRDNNYILNDYSLKNLALHYAINSEHSSENIDLILDSEKIGDEQNIIELFDLAQINYIRNFDLFANELCIKLKS